MRTLSILCLLFCLGCETSNYQSIKKIYDNRNRILDVFNNISVIKSRGDSGFYIISSHSGDKQNDYFFEYQNKHWSFFRDTLAFRPDHILFKEEPASSDSTVFKKQLVNKLNFFRRMMDSLEIRNISHDFRFVGIDMKIYTKSHGVLLYVSDLKKVTIENWVNYINGMKKLNNNWYYTETEYNKD